MDFERLQSGSDERITKLQEILQRSANVDEATGGFRKLGEEAKTVEHKLVEPEKEMLNLLNQGWELEKELNDGGKIHNE